MRWWNAVCRTLRKRGPMSLTRVPQTLANSPAPDLLSCDVMTSLQLYLQR